MKKLFLMMFILLNIPPVVYAGNKINTDSVFVLKAKLEFIVPLSYDHKSQVDCFSEQWKNQKDITDYDSDITDGFFGKFQQLQPGKKYELIIYSINQEVTADKCLHFIKKQKGAIVAGPQTLTLMYELLKDKLPKQLRLLALSENRKTLESKGCHWISLLDTNIDNTFSFYVACVENKWGHGDRTDHGFVADHIFYLVEK